MTMAFDAHTSDSDDDLLALYAAGDRMAARALAGRLTPRSLGYAMRLLGGDRAEAEDVVQEAMLRLWRIAPDWRRGEAQVSTWLYRVVTNLCTDRQRRLARHARPMGDDLPDVADDRPDADARLVQADRMAALNGALAALPPRQREAVILRHIEGLANPEIAQILGIGVEAVESLTARGKRALATALETQRDGLGYEEN
jgi:RNA polymerase sigma factor (sigma-70 family)